MSSKLNYFDEYVSINGIDQYLLHCTSTQSNPIMLFLHGGPGSAESLFAHSFQENWEKLFTVVHWDQRGAGKTLTKNKDSYPTIDSMIKDLFEVIQYLKKKYNKEKIILLGHSWGSVLGSIFIKQYPKEVDYYIGVGQVINLLENERVGYKKVKELVLAANDNKSLKKLDALGDYPGDVFDSSTIKKCDVVRSIQAKYDLAINPNFSILWPVVKSPIFKFSDVGSMLKAGKSNKKIIDFLGNFNLYSESLKYEVPIYYILGDKDWQTPYILAKDYFDKIDAPDKNLYLIPGAGHITMLDQPQLFFNSLLEINNRNKQISTY